MSDTSWYKVSKKRMAVIGSVLNRPEKLHSKTVFYIPVEIWTNWIEKLSGDQFVNLYAIDAKNLRNEGG